MAVIKVRDPNTGDIKQFRIEGDTPTDQEKQNILNVFNQTQQTTPELGVIRGLGTQSKPQTLGEQVDQEIQKDFDTTTGVSNFSLRAALSVAENDEEEDAIMAKQGFTSDEFTRDKRGRLALTPTGASKLGINTEKNILIDEEGFSASDFTDLLGIVPELAGGVTGAVKGAAIGSSFAPGVGTLLGGAIGAFVGGASGSLAEEAIEGVAGVSEQTAGEIATDAVVEGGIAAGGELLFGIPILVFKGLAPSGKRFIKEASEEELKFTAEAMEKGYIPTRTTLKVNPIAAKQEQLTESVSGVSPRLRQVHQAMKRDTEKLRSIIDDAAVQGSDKEAGELFIDFAENAGFRYIRAKNAAMKNIGASVERAAEDIAGSFRTGSTVSDDLYNFLADSVKAFDDEAARQFATIQEVTNSTLGKQKNFIPTNSITDVKELIESSFPARNLANAEDSIAQKLLDDLNEFGKKTNFNQVYTLRKKLLDVSKYTGDNLVDVNIGRTIDNSTRLTQIFKLAGNKLDNILTETELTAFAKAAKNLTKADEQKLALAARELPSAREFFKEGMKQFESLSSTLSIPSLVGLVRGAARTGEVPTVSPGLAMKMVTPGSTKALNNLKQAMTQGANAPGEAAYNTIKEEIGKSWLRHTMQTTGFDTATPKIFKPSVLQREVDELGDVGNELFGAQTYNQIKSFARQFDDLKISKLDDETLIQALDNGLQVGIRDALATAIDAAKKLSTFKNLKVRRGIANRNLKADEAADVVAAPGVTKFELEEIMRYYEGDEGALKTIRGHYLESMLQDVGATTNAKQMKELALRIEKADKNKKLNVIFGDDTGEQIRKFGKFVELASKNTSDSSLVAGGITASFFNNIGKILRITAIGQIFTGKRAIDDIIKAGKEASTGGEAAKRKFADMVTDYFRVGQGVTQSMQEGVRDAESQLTALAKNTGVTQAVNRGLGQITNPIRNVAPPAANTAVGNIDVTDPGVASVLGLNPSDAAIAGRQIRRSNLMRQTP